MDLLTTLATLALGLALGAVIGVLWARSRPRDEGVLAALEQRGADQAVVKEGMERLQDQLRDLEHARSSWQGQFSQQVSDMRLTTESLRKETSSLSTALRKPQVRGRWGEMHLRRAVELAGLVPGATSPSRHPWPMARCGPTWWCTSPAASPWSSTPRCHSTRSWMPPPVTTTRSVRPTCVVTSVSCRTHVDQLGSKAYWRALPETPEFVVMFVPAEAFLSAALETQEDLLEYAAARQVILATPTTLIALLRTVAHGWSHERLAGQAAEVQRLGSELLERLATMGTHVDRVGRSLGAAVTAYNQAVGSLEGRVLVTARRFNDLGVSGELGDSPRQVEQVPRSLGAPELEPDDLPAVISRR